ncbi:MAG: 8-amino-7-oxononanoate synthase [Candidatus Caenarcaniphilales bacterium]|nr:8-amino-7-oxononanoate synthase [Candidatus Caenarcaniphilales bacterium]
MSEALPQFLSKKLSRIRKVGWERTLIVQKPLSPLQRQIKGQNYLQFSSNDYLGLSKDQRIIRSGIEAAQVYGTGSTGSRLITGTTDLHTRLEEALAEFTGREAALFFSSGYSANLGVISALIGSGDAIYADAYNHASLKSGATLSGAMSVTYGHLDYANLRSKLQATRHLYQNALLVSDSIFSMDGDQADLKVLIDLSHEFDLWLMVDEAHSLGVFGKHGRGLCHGLDVPILMGTGSKAFGVEGGFVAGSRNLIDYMIQRASSFKYSTAPTPFTVGALGKSLEIIDSAEGDLLRQKLQVNANRIRAICLEAGFDCIKGDSPIIIIPTRDIDQAQTWSTLLWQAGIWIQPIRPPTAPAARLRITASALLEEDQLKQLRLALQSMNRSPK